MSTEIARVAPVANSLPDMVRYAQHLADAGLLPAQYRKQPANVLWAMEYGRTLNITTIAAINGIHVIEGKPTASAALIGGLVRRAGHKLRVSGNNLLATAQIIRHDDPDFVYEVTWELRRNQNGNPNAEDAGLLNKSVWKNYSAAMLKARAITAVARDACEEELFGLHYTPEELGAYVDQDGNPVDAPVQPLRAVQAEAERDWLAEARAAATAEQVRDIYTQAGAAGAPRELADQITEIGRQKPSAAAPPTPPSREDGITEAEVVEDGQDEHAAALDALRAAAVGAGLAANLDTDFQGSYGVTPAEATVEQLREATALIAGAA